jgi:hypothetical protein
LSFSPRPATSARDAAIVPETAAHRTGPGSVLAHPQGRDARRKRDLRQLLRNPVRPSRRRQRIHVIGRIESARPDNTGLHTVDRNASKYAYPMSPGSRQTLPSAREVPESPPVATSPVQEIVIKQIVAAPTNPVPKSAAESFSTVAFEAVTESHSGGVMGKMPLLRRLHRAPEFVPPRPVQETTRRCPKSCFVL